MTTSKIGDARCYAIDRSRRIIGTNEAVLLLLRRLPVVLLGLVGHGQRTCHVRAQRFAGRAADIADDGEIVRQAKRTQP